MTSPTDPALPFVGLAALSLAAVHGFAGRLATLDAIPRNRFLSLSGGVSVAYVFVHVLPELERAGRRAERQSAALADVVEQVYLLALVGFVVYYGLEQFARRAEPPESPASSSGGVFWLHIGSFAVYNALVGTLLMHRDTPGAGSLFTFGFAMLLHFFVTDHGLRDHHAAAYREVGRWVLASAVLAGTVVGLLTTPDPTLLGGVFAFLSGGIVLNAVKEELPPERESRFWAFALGAGGYGLLLQFL